MGERLYERVDRELMLMDQTPEACLRRVTLVDEVRALEDELQAAREACANERMHREIANELVGRKR